MNLLKYLKKGLYYIFFIDQYSLKRIERSDIKEYWRINSKRI